MVAFVSSQLLGGGLSVKIVAVWGLYNAVLARTVSPGCGKKRMIPCDPLFYSQPHMTSKRAAIGHFYLLHEYPQWNSNRIELFNYLQRIIVIICNYTAVCKLFIFVLNA